VAESNVLSESGDETSDTENPGSFSDEEMEDDAQPNPLSRAQETADIEMDEGSSSETSQDEEGSKYTDDSDDDDEDNEDINPRLGRSKKPDVAVKVTPIERSSPESDEEEDEKDDADSETSEESEDSDNDEVH